MIGGPTLVMGDRAPTIPLLAWVEFQSRPQGSDPAASWIDGGSEPAARLRSKASAIARDGFSVAAIAGEPGVGKRRVAQWIHGASRRNGRTVWVSRGDSPDLLARLTQLRDRFAAGDPSGDGPGNLIVTAAERAPAEVISALLEVLTAQGVQLRCGVILTSRVEVADLRGRSLLHGQLLGRAGHALLQVPPLRRRPADIAPLCRAFVAEASARYGRNIRGLSPQAIARLQQHTFPGNVRELRARIETAVVDTNSDWLTADSFPSLPQPASTETPEGAEVVIRMPGSSLREIELQALRLALRLSDGRIVRASELLGITRHALRRKLEKYGLNDLRHQSAGGDDGDGDAFI